MSAPINTDRTDNSISNSADYPFLTLQKLARWVPAGKLNLDFLMEERNFAPSDQIRIGIILTKLERARHFNQQQLIEAVYSWFNGLRPPAGPDSSYSEQLENDLRFIAHIFNQPAHQIFISAAVYNENRLVTKMSSELVQSALKKSSICKSILEKIAQKNLTEEVADELFMQTFLSLGELLEIPPYIEYHNPHLIERLTFFEINDLLKNFKDKCTFLLIRDDMFIEYLNQLPEYKQQMVALRNKHGVDILRQQGIRIFTEEFQQEHSEIITAWAKTVCEDELGDIFRKIEDKLIHETIFLTLFLLSDNATSHN